MLIVWLLPLLFSFVSSTRLEQHEIVKQSMPPHIVEALSKSKYIVYVTDFASRSHTRKFLPVAEELVKRGHRIGFAALLDVSFDWVKGYPIERLIRLKGTAEYHDPTNSSARQVVNDWWINFKQNQIEPGYYGMNLMRAYFEARIEFYEGIYLSMKDEFEARPPDLIVCDFISLNCLDYALTTGTPYVVFVGVAIIDFFPGKAKVMPTGLSGHTPFSVSYLERVAETFFLPFFGIYYLLGPTLKLNELRKKVGAMEVFLLDRFFEKKHVFASNYIGHEIPRYTPPFLHIIGAAVESDNQLMNDDLKRWLDEVASKKEAVVYMAFGSHIDFSSTVLQALVRGVLFDCDCSNSCQNNNADRFPSRQQLTKGIHLLWGTSKTDVRTILSEEMYSHPRDFNLRNMKWTPQVKVLNHPAVKLFVSHGGLESTLESNRAAKPMLLVPGFGDQPYNARRGEELGYGLWVDPLKLTAEKVCLKRKHLVEQFLSNETFRLHLDKIAKLVYFSSQQYERAADIIEMEAEIGSGHLFIPEDEWPFYRRHNLDVLALPLVCIAAVLWFCCRRWANKKSSKLKST